MNLPLILTHTVSRTHTLSLATLFLLASCSLRAQPIKEIRMEKEDREILENLFSQYSDHQGTPVSALMVEIGSYFEGFPYVAHTLEKEPEKLVVNLREFDCTTFVENCLAISRSIRSGQADYKVFQKELQTIRYRNGEIDGYGSRIHYFSDWIHTNEKKSIIKDISREVGGIPFPGMVDFMSTHPGSYRQLEADPELVGILSKQEKEISSRKMFYIPESRIKEADSLLRDGDIVGITTDIKGLDIIHVGILLRESDQIHLMHASSRAKNVVISKGSLEDYLKANKSATGIMVARPK